MERVVLAFRATLNGRIFSIDAFFEQAVQTDSCEYVLFAPRSFEPPVAHLPALLRVAELVLPDPDKLGIIRIVAKTFRGSGRAADAGTGKYGNGGDQKNRLKQFHNRLLKSPYYLTGCSLSSSLLTGNS
jgi:hypothetical protein